MAGRINFSRHGGDPGSVEHFKKQMYDPRELIASALPMALEGPEAGAC